MNVLFYDRDVAVAVKPSGVPSQPDPTGDPDMTQLLSDFFKEKNENPQIYPIHRLDRGTGGVMVFARTKNAAASLSKAVAEGKLTKIYYAVTAEGSISGEGELRDILFHDKRQNRVYVADKERKGALPASLLYRKLSDADKMSLYAVRLLTGRTHQIRVQFASRQMSLVGDGKYGSRIKAPFPALYAVRLSFPHPKTGKTVTFSAYPDEGTFPFSAFLLPNVTNIDL